VDDHQGDGAQHQHEANGYDASAVAPLPTPGVPEQPPGHGEVESRDDVEHLDLPVIGSPGYPTPTTAPAPYAMTERPWGGQRQPDDLHIIPDAEGGIEVVHRVIQAAGTLIVKGIRLAYSGSPREDSAASNPPATPTHNGEHQRTFKGRQPSAPRSDEPWRTPTDTERSSFKTAAIGL
jgi:hypothetical protein